MMKLSYDELDYYWRYQDLCNKKLHYDKIFTYSHTGDHVCTFNTESEVIIAVDATDKDNGDGEWDSNFDFSPPIQGFHRGFYTTAKYFYLEHIRPLLEKLDSEVPVTLIFEFV